MWPPLQGRWEKLPAGCRARDSSSRRPCQRNNFLSLASGSVAPVRSREIIRRIISRRRCTTVRRSGQASRAISTGQLHALLRFHLRPIKLLVSKCPSASYDEGDLVLEGASHLDAFSGYPFRTWLPGSAAGATTDTPLVRPSRSSRTRDRSPQVSFAHGG